MKVVIMGGATGIGLALAQHYRQRMPEEVAGRYPLLHRYQFDISGKPALNTASEEFGAIQPSCGRLTMGTQAPSHSSCRRHRRLRNSSTLSRSAGTC
jgi:hypothetical protein